jgi:hypothetical protein
MIRECIMRFVMLAAILSVLAIPASAQSYHAGGNGPHFGNGDGGRPHHVHPAPIPLAGAGLPALGLALSAYGLVRATRKRKNNA